MINLLFSLIFGAFLDSLYYCLFVTNCKGIKCKRKSLFIITFIAYILMFMIFRYNMYLYLVFYVFIYLVLKKLYKSEIIDYFVLIFSGIYYLLISIACYYLISVYFIALIVDKILLFLPIILHKQLQRLYAMYYKMWNRNRLRKMPIKSLTLRNIGIVIFHTFIVINYIILLSLCS